ncbi:mitochondrial import inner membrane translocase subunit Tim10 B [Mugil cephalus]|uniref:mitochondrial import inner membrane translocase subunit Tim10 B n=1 Tax=Mugil cephalus TaxID=48193 RepID=UPI001FB7F3E0|nr:mitochondrial import inner membrane translocase subunit Tim10 B [Mugil cephalus]
MDPDQQLRNLRDFLLVYNRMTEICFQRCTSNFNYRNLTMDEEQCVDSCAGKLIRSNHRLMGTYVQLMPRMVQRRMEEMESKAAENAKAAEAAASGAAGTAITEASPPPQPPFTPSPNTQVSSFLSPSLTDVGADVRGSALEPAGLGIPAEVNGAVSTSTSEVKLSAAALTPATETVNPSVLNEAGNGPSYMTGLSQPPVAGAQIDSGSSAPLLMPSQPSSFSDGVLTAAPPALKSERLSGQDRGQQAPTNTTNS